MACISPSRWSAQPGHRGELHPVGLLVQAHPEPEVVRVDAELALDVHDVGRDQQQPAGRRVERVELAEHLAGEEAEQPADLGAGDPGADRVGEPATARFLPDAACRRSGASTVAKPSAFACTQPARSTTRTGAVRSAASSPVKSRTSPVERFAPVAELGDRRGGLGAGDLAGRRRRSGSPSDTARSQSTIPAPGCEVMRATVPAPPGLPQRAAAGGERAGGARRGRPARPGCRAASISVGEQREDHRPPVARR